jgi:hypothetical protein
MSFKTPTDQNEASQYRQVRVKLPTRDKVDTYQGGQVYSITDKGVVVCFGPNFHTRTFYPWHVIVDFVYHHTDESARKQIQGW